MAVASVVLPFLPLLAKQILANNFLSDLPLLAISTDSVDEEILRRPGHWDFQHLLRVMLGFGLVSSAFDWLTFGLLLAVFDADATTFQTAWFIESLLTELIIILVMRTRRAFYSSSPSLSLVGAILAVAAVALALPYIPWAGALALRPLEPILLLTVVTVALGYGLASEILKQWLNGLNIGRKRRTNFAKRAHMK
jgi:Mg2+-importing ATPase